MKSRHAQGDSDERAQVGADDAPPDTGAWKSASPIGTTNRNAGRLAALQRVAWGSPSSV